MLCSHDDSSPLLHLLWHMCRNVTLTGPAGSNASVDSMPVIDLQNKVGILELCSSCTFSFLWVAIANENRAGTGGGISVFRGKPGSKVEWMGGVGLRPACAPTAPAVALVNNTQRSSLFPSPPGGRQLAKSVDFTYKVNHSAVLQKAVENVLERAEHAL